MYGAFDIASMPPPTPTSRSPARIAWSRIPTPRIPLAHTLLTVSDETSFGMPPLICAWRLGICPWPACSTWPKTTCWTSSPFTSARSSAASIALPPRSVASSGERPPPSFPNGVRAAPMIAVLGMFWSSLLRSEGAANHTQAPSSASDLGVRLAEGDVLAREVALLGPLGDVRRVEEHRRRDAQVLRPDGASVIREPARARPADPRVARVHRPCPHPELVDVREVVVILVVPAVENAVAVGVRVDVVRPHGSRERRVPGLEVGRPVLVDVREAVVVEVALVVGQDPVEVPVVPHLRSGGIGLGRLIAVAVVDRVLRATQPPQAVLGPRVEA